MSYRTVAVDLENGRVTPQGAETLPAKAHALLTLLPPDPEGLSGPQTSGSGLGHFLATPAFRLTKEQWRASMDAEFLNPRFDWRESEIWGKFAPESKIKPAENH